MDERDSSGVTGSRARDGRTLLFDADDTLWENNIYFERAIAAFISYLDHKTHTAEEVREHLNTCEHATIAKMGYGVRSFRQSLLDCFAQLSTEPLTPDRHAQIVAFTNLVAAHEIELLPGVMETLRTLSARHRLVLVTKGVLEEQVDKLERSGLRSFFSGVEVLEEKNAAAYRHVVESYACEPATTWMVGNSPKSDINPALAAGLNAVFIPHNNTWVLEHEVIAAPKAQARLLEVAAFSELTLHF